MRLVRNYPDGLGHRFRLPWHRAPVGHSGEPVPKGSGTARATDTGLMAVRLLLVRGLPAGATLPLHTLSLETGMLESIALNTCRLVSAGCGGDYS